MSRRHNKKNKQSKRSKKGGRSQQALWKLPSFTTGIPDQIQTVLVYEELLSLNPASPRTNYTFRGNSVYDPNYTGVGHQPGYFDTLSAIYGRFRTLSSNIQVEVSNTSGAAPMLFTIVPDTDPVTFTTFQDAAENPRARISKLLPVATRIPYTVRHFMSTSVQLGLMQPSEIYDEDYSHSPAGNPNNMWYWNIFFTAADQATNIYFNVRVRIKYKVQIYDRYTVTPSFKLTDVTHSREVKNASPTIPAPINITVDEPETLSLLSESSDPNNTLKNLVYNHDVT